jgi:hypothetical protein
MLTTYETALRFGKRLFFVSAVNNGSAIAAEIEVAFDFFLFFVVDFIVASRSWTLHLGLPSDAGFAFLFGKKSFGRIRIMAPHRSHQLVDSMR